MPDKKISQLYADNPADAFDGTELFEVTLGNEGWEKGGYHFSISESFSINS